METARPDTIAGPFRLLFEVGTVAGMTDGQLLDRFLDRRRLGAEGAEVAFGALVDRHGAMVLRVCRSRLGDEHDAQDAFQATFLILARKAGSIRNRDSAASWLQGVARRVASCARRAAAVRRAKERSASRPDVEPSTDLDPGELVPAVREEVGDLPEKYRAPLLLCLLDGLTHEEAATRLGWPVGTVKTRVRQAKDRLRTRLTRRGFAPTLGMIAAALTTREALALPLALVRSTARAALRYASGKAITAGAASASVATLVQLGIGSLLMSRIKSATLAVALMGTLAAGATGYARQGAGVREKTEPVQVKAVVKTEPNLTYDPKAVEITEVDRLTELESAKLDLEIMREELASLKRAVFHSVSTLKQTQESLDKIGSAQTLEEIRGMGYALGPDDDLSSAKQRLDANFHSERTRVRDKLAQSRAEYLATVRQLNQAVQRIMDLDKVDAVPEINTEAQVAGSTGRSGQGTVAGDPERFEEIDALKIDLDNLELIVNQLKDDITTMQRDRLSAERYLRMLSGSQITGMVGGIGGGMGGGSSTPEELEVTKKQYQEHIVAIDAELPKLRQEFLAKNRELRRKRQQLESLEKSTGVAVPAPAPATTRTPPTDVEQRLGDLERKLHRVLKALEARPGGK